jgi:hypothetical protein
MMEIRVPKKLKKKLGSVPLTATDAPIVSTYAQIFSFFSRIIRINDSHFQPKKKKYTGLAFCNYLRGRGDSALSFPFKKEKNRTFLY